MKTYVINIESVKADTKKTLYMIEAEDLLSAKEIAEEKFYKENPAEKIINLKLDNPDHNKIGEILDLIKERI